MKLSDVLLAKRALQALSGSRMPPAVAYAIAKNLKVLTDEAQIIEAQRKVLADKYASKDENGNPLSKDGLYVFDDGGENFKEEFIKYLEVETVATIKRIPASELLWDDEKYDILTPAQMMELEFMIEVEEE